jgi:hypothetical protein
MTVAAIETRKLRICVTKVRSLLRLPTGRRKAVGAAFDDHTGLLQEPPNSVSTHESQLSPDAPGLSAGGRSGAKGLAAKGPLWGRVFHYASIARGVLES